MSLYGHKQIIWAFFAHLCAVSYPKVQKNALNGNFFFLPAEKSDPFAEKRVTPPHPLSPPPPLNCLSPLSHTLYPTMHARRNREKNVLSCHQRRWKNNRVKESSLSITSSAEHRKKRKTNFFLQLCYNPWKKPSYFTSSDVLCQTNIANLWPYNT